MNEQDKEHARLLASLFAMNGLLAYGGAAPLDMISNASVEYADALLEALEPKETVGLPAIKRRSKKDA
jgi:hypothetical protein